MWRTFKALTLLSLVPGGVLAQVSSTLLETRGALDLRSQMAALEKSRESLLQARHAVDAALSEVERAMETLRALTEMGADSVRTFQPPATPRLRWALDAASSLRSDFNERLRACQPVVEQLRWAACQALVRRDQAGNEEVVDTESASTDGSPSGQESANGGAAAPIQAAILREEDARPFAALASSGAVVPVDPQLHAVAAPPSPPLESPTVSVSEAATDRDLSRDFSSAAACVEPVLVMPPPAASAADDMAPVLPLGLSRE